MEKEVVEIGKSAAIENIKENLFENKVNEKSATIELGSIEIPTDKNKFVDAELTEVDRKIENTETYLEETERRDKDITEKLADKKILYLPRPGEASYQAYQDVYNQNYSNNKRSSYLQNRTPVYHQKLDGQSVYYESPPPQNVSRGGPAYYVNDPNEADRRRYYQAPEIFTSAFDTVRIRNRFVQRVYTILSMQLFATFGFILLVIFEENMRGFFRKYSLILMLASMVGFLVVYIVLICCEGLRRTSPINFILLGLLTIFMTIMLSAVSAFAETKIVLYAIGTTALVCFLVSIIAIQIKWDVTGCGMCLCIATLVLMIFGLIVMIMHLCGFHYKILDIVYSSIATLLFCFWLMFDTQQIVGGRRIELSPEEYIVGAVSLYVDISYIFLHILTLYTLCRG